MKPLIAPSILSANFARLGEDVRHVLDAGAEIVHFDVMDNHFVPNLTIGPLICEALRNDDVHLMVEPVDRIIPDFARAGATYITFHPEASRHIDRSLSLIRDEGCKSGLVFNPATPLNWLEHVIDKVDMVLLMSVNPGFGGQKFIPSALDKLRDARRMIDDSGLEIRLEIDGGVKVDNIGEIAAAGADTFVAAISREHPTSRDSSWRLTLICMPSGWVMASGSLQRSMIACATRPVTSTNARSPSLRLVRSSLVASCVASSNTRPGLSLAICRKRGYVISAISLSVRVLTQALRVGCS